MDYYYLYLSGCIDPLRMTLPFAGMKLTIDAMEKNIKRDTSYNMKQLALEQWNQQGAALIVSGSLRTLK